MGKRGPKKGEGGRPVKLPERMHTTKLPEGGNEDINSRAEAKGMTRSDWVRWRLLGVKP